VGTGTKEKQIITRRIIGFAVAAAATVSAPGPAAAQPEPPVQRPQVEQPAAALQDLLSQGELRQLADEPGKDFLENLRGLSAEEVAALLAQDPQRLGEILDLVNQAAQQGGAADTGELTRPVIGPLPG
jgi:hypothetical protein